MQNTDQNIGLSSLLRKRDFTDKHIAEMEKLLGAGANPNLQVGGSPALIKCIDHGNPPKAVQLLLAHGADPNVKDKQRHGSRPEEGETALARAACSGWRAHADDWVASLVESGADVNLRDSQGRTVMDYLLEQMRYYARFYRWHDDMDQIAILVCARTFLHTAGPLSETMRFLVDKGAEPSSEIDDYNNGVAQVQEHWDRCIKWLVQHRYLKMHP